MSIRKLLLSGLAAASILGLAGVAQAQPATPVSGTVNITGTVDDRCSFDEVSVAYIDLSEMTNGAGTLNSGAVDGRFADLHAWCNGTASTLAVTSYPLLNTTYAGPAVPGFTGRVDFVGTANTSGGSNFDGTLADGSDNPAVNIGIFDGLIHVVLSASTATGQLIAGNYAGRVVLTLTPNTSFEQNGGGEGGGGGGGGGSGDNGNPCGGNCGNGNGGGGGNGTGNEGGGNGPGGNGGNGGDGGNNGNGNGNGGGNGTGNEGNGNGPNKP